MKLRQVGASAGTCRWSCFPYTLDCLTKPKVRPLCLLLSTCTYLMSAQDEIRDRCYVQYSKGPAVELVEKCRLCAIVPVKSLSIDGNNRECQYADECALLLKCRCFRLVHTRPIEGLLLYMASKTHLTVSGCSPNSPRSVSTTSLRRSLSRCLSSLRWLLAALAPAPATPSSS